MLLVTKWEDIKRNLLRLEEYQNSSDREEAEFYLSLIRRGRCFIIYKQGARVLFGPSRFVGYANNNMHSHRTNESKDGTITNAAIKNIFNQPATEDETAEREYRRLCERLGIQPSSIRRKYWVRSESKQ